jgi:FkbM family methyltransferase
VELIRFIKHCLPNFQVNFVFDVGANIGQSARSYLNKFPDSRIYCFEPVDATFRELQKNLQSYGNVLTFKLALGAGRGRGKMVLEGSSDLFYLLNTSQCAEQWQSLIGVAIREFLNPPAAPHRLREEGGLS